MTPDEVRALPVTVDVPTAGRCFGLGRDASYDLARLGELPVPVLKLGRSLRVTRSSLLDALGIADAAMPAAPSTPLTSRHLALVEHSASESRSDAA